MTQNKLNISAKTPCSSMEIHPPHPIFRRPPGRPISPLLSLPFELRIAIWRYLFRDNSVLLSTTYRRGYMLLRQAGATPASRQRAGILATCRVCYYEIRPVFLSMTRFRIEATGGISERLLQEIERLLPLCNIRHLMIGPSCRPDPTFSQLIRNIDEYFPNLSSLQIRVALFPTWNPIYTPSLKVAIEHDAKFHFCDDSFVALLRAALKDRRRRPKGNCTTTLVCTHLLDEYGTHYSKWPGKVVAWIDLHEWVLRVDIMGEVFEANFETL